MRTYAGHSSAVESNALYRRNLAKGQTGLSVAFDLPTQTGYDPDAELARGEVGKVGVPISHVGDLRALFDGIPLEKMNTSMTINAPAMYLLALYLTVADEHAEAAGMAPDELRAQLAGTTQNDIIKEYLSRGTYVFPPAPSLRLITDMIAYTVDQRAEVEPDQRLQLSPAGGRGDAGAGGRVRAVHGDRRAGRGARLRPGAGRSEFGEVVARISFFVNAGVRFVEEMCKLRAFGELWDEITLERYGVQDPRAPAVPLRRAGELARPHRGAAGEQRLPHPARDAGRDDVPRRPGPRGAAAGVERGAGPAARLGPAVVAAHAAGARLRVGPARVRRPLRRARRSSRRRSPRSRHGARAEIDRVLEMGGAVAAVESGYLKSALVSSLALRRRRIESGEDVVVGVNRFTESEPNPLVGGADGGILTVDPAVEQCGGRGDLGPGGPGATRQRSTTR